MTRRPPEPDEGKTLEIAARLHAGQADWGGKPYTMHLLAVRDLLGPDATEVERKSALLHDTLEDVRIPDGTPKGRRMSADDLRDLGFGEEVVAIVEILTKPPEAEGWWRGMPRAEMLAESERRYFRRIEDIVATGNVSAMRVKLADNIHNGDPARDAALLDPRDLERARRYRNRYARSAAMLREAISRADTHNPAPAPRT